MFPRNLRKIIKCECGTPLVKRVGFSEYEIIRNLRGETTAMPVSIPEKNGNSLMVKCPKCGMGMTFCIAVESVGVSDEYNIKNMED